MPKLPPPRRKERRRRKALGEYYEQGKYWDGSEATALEGADINNDGYVLKSATVRRIENGEVEEVSILSLIPQKFQKQVRNITARFISDKGSGDGNPYYIEFHAENLEGEGNGSWVWRPFLLKVSESGNSLKVLQEPEIYQASWKTINSNGIIAALGKPTATDTNKHAFLLVPVSLIDTKDGVLDEPGASVPEANRDVNIVPKKDENDKNSRSIAWIEPHGADDGSDAPDMPQLALRLPGTEQMGLKIKWKLTVKYTRPKCSKIAKPL